MNESISSWIWSPNLSACFVSIMAKYCVSWFKQIFHWFIFFFSWKLSQNLFILQLNLLLLVALILLMQCMNVAEAFSIGYSLYFPYYGYGGGIGFRHPTPPFWGRRWSGLKILPIFPYTSSLEICEWKIDLYKCIQCCNKSDNFLLQIFLNGFSSLPRENDE